MSWMSNIVHMLGHDMTGHGWAAFRSLSFIAVLGCGDPALADSFADFYGISNRVNPDVSTMPESEILAPQVRLPVKVVVSKTAHVVKDRILLSDIANCVGMKSLCDEISSIDLGKSPLPGSSQKLRKEMVETILGEEITSAEIGVESLENINIVADWQPLNENDVASAIREALAADPEQFKPYRIDVQKVFVPSSFKLRPGAYHLDFDSLVENVAGFLNQRKLSGSEIMSLSVVVTSMDGSWPQQRLIVKVKTEVAMQVAVTTHDLKRGDILSESDVTLAFSNIRRLSSRAFDDGFGFLGLALKQALTKGTVLLASHVEVNKIIKRGDAIKVRLSADDLDLQSSGIALSDGGQGERINVAVGKAKKKFEAKILNKSLVEVIH